MQKQRNLKQDFVAVVVAHSFDFGSDFDVAVTFVVDRQKISGGRWRLHLDGGVEKARSAEAVESAWNMN